MRIIWEEKGNLIDSHTIIFFDSNLITILTEYKKEKNCRNFVDMFSSPRRLTFSYEYGVWSCTTILTMSLMISTEYDVCRKFYV